MKTIKKEAQIKRVQDSEAESFVKRGWTYCAKSEWKSQVRDVKVVKEEPIIETKPTESKKKFKKGVTQKKGK